MADNPDHGYCALALAIVAQAAKDAKNGDIEAALYLVGRGCDILEATNHDAAAARRFVAYTFDWPLAALQPLELA